MTTPPSALWTCPHLLLSPLASSPAKMASPQLYVWCSQPPSHGLSKRFPERFGSLRMSISWSVSWNIPGSNSYSLFLNSVMHSRISRNCARAPRSATCRRSRGKSLKLASRPRPRPAHTQSILNADSRSTLSPADEGQVGPR